MGQAIIEELRETIRGLGPDSKALERQEFTRVVRALKKDILAAHSRGVTWKSLAAAVSDKTGHMVSAGQMRDKIKALAKEPEPTAKDKSHGGHFIVAAVTPEGDLYQLERNDLGFYVTNSVSADGILHVCAGKEFPCPTADKAEAVRRFKGWSRKKGFEIYGGHETA